MTAADYCNMHKQMLSYVYLKTTVIKVRFRLRAISSCSLKN